MASPRDRVKVEADRLRANKPSANGSAHGQAPSTPPAVELVTRTAAGITPKETEWLWPLRLPRGMLSEIIGDPGDGKSTITAEIAARASNGWDFPPQSGATGTPTPVLFLNAEDSAEHTTARRLRAANADLNRVEVLDCVRAGDHRGPLILPTHLHLVREKVKRTGCGVIILDPFTAFIAAAVDANSDKDVRSAQLYPLKDLAEETGAAVVLVRHLNKGAGKAVYRGGGSIAFTGAVRVSLATGKTQDGKRYLACVKTNVGPMPKAIEYAIEQGDEGSRVVWGQEVDMDADDLFTPPAGGRGERTEEAEQFLRDLLAGGPVTVGRDESDPATVRGAAAKRGLRWRTVELAKGKLGVRAVKARGEFAGAWCWELPATVADIPE